LNYDFGGEFKRLLQKRLPKNLMSWTRMMPPISMQSCRQKKEEVISEWMI
jgi:hypothetical protein